MDKNSVRFNSVSTRHTPLVGALRTSTPTRPAPSIQPRRTQSTPSSHLPPRSPPHAAAHATQHRRWRRASLVVVKLSVPVGGHTGGVDARRDDEGAGAGGEGRRWGWGREGNDGQMRWDGDGGEMIHRRAGGERRAAAISATEGGGRKRRRNGEGRLTRRLMIIFAIDAEAHAYSAGTAAPSITTALEEDVRGASTRGRPGSGGGLRTRRGCLCAWARRGGGSVSKGVRADAVRGRCGRRRGGRPRRWGEPEGGAEGELTSPGGTVSRKSTKTRTANHPTPAVIAGSSFPPSRPRSVLKALPQLLDQ
ncbi:hypothetical protein B0H17DRAFT_1150903 [Mycena rosella]|uniref:Uncharacterized protein n=1 Tax=Mycena rosella TaxID=1033263 RepID=A0AAD7FLF2_MYCRO|nr:hypothetical protein B0H17DRAFT_1150903 [Mycena rosella]